MSDRISPTAHYTGQVWVRNNLSISAMDTWPGRAMYYSLSPYFFISSKFTRGYTLEHMLLERHYTIDQILEKAILSGRVTQVLEIAAGLSARGYRFATRFGDSGLSYYEGDLQAMSKVKKERFEKGGLNLPNHHFLTLDTLSTESPGRLEDIIASPLDQTKGTAIITEGLLSYLDKSTIQSLWRRFSTMLNLFPHGVYISDLRFKGGGGWLSRNSLFSRLLRLTVRGNVFYDNFDNENQTVAVLKNAEFKTIDLRTPLSGMNGMPKGPGIIRVIEAWVDPTSRTEQNQ